MEEYIEIKVTKEDLVNMVSSTTPSLSECDNYTETGIMEFCGNQYNEKWNWVKSELMRMSLTTLYALYLKHK